MTYGVLRTSFVDRLFDFLKHVQITWVIPWETNTKLLFKCCGSSPGAFGLPILVGYRLFCFIMLYFYFIDCT